MCSSVSDAEVSTEHGLDRRGVHDDTWAAARPLHRTGREIRHCSKWRLRVWRTMIKAALLVCFTWSAMCKSQAIHDVMNDNMTAALAACNGRCELIRLPESPGSRMALEVLTHHERAGLLRPRGRNDQKFTEAVTSLMQRHVKALCSPPSDPNRAFAYIWFNSSSRNLGKASWARKTFRNRTGPVWRFQAHVRNIFASKNKEKNVLKYKLARRAELWSHYFLILPEGDIREAEAMETFAINALDPVGNTKKQNRNRVRGARGKRQRKGPLAKKLNYGTIFSAKTKEMLRSKVKPEVLDGPEANTFVTSFRVPDPAARKERREVEEAAWSLPFEAAYDKCLRVAAGSSATPSVLDIYYTKYRRLLLLYAMKMVVMLTGIESDAYGMIQIHRSWRFAWPARFLLAQGGAFARARVTYHCRRKGFLRVALMCSKYLTGFTSPHIRKFIEKQLSLLPLTRDIKSFLIGNTRFVLGRSETLSQCGDASRVSRLVELSEFEQIPEHEKEEFRMGKDLMRKGGT